MIKVEKQLYDGVQKRPYDDHVWQWILTVTENEPRETVLQWCLDNLNVWSGNQLPKEEYYRIIRDVNTSFEEQIKAECRGYYQLMQDDGNFVFTIVQPYID